MSNNISNKQLDMLFSYREMHVVEFTLNVGLAGGRQLPEH